MGIKSLARLAALVGLAISASNLRAQTTTNTSLDRSDSSATSYSPSTPTFPTASLANLQPCSPSSGLTLCRWDNIQVEYVQTRLLKIGTAFGHELVIKGKGKEIVLTYGLSPNLPIANAVASCERMAISSREGSGLLSFYAQIYPTGGDNIEEGFQGNRVKIVADVGSNTYLELGCFLTSS